jgi:hypothetical protein
MAKLIQAIARYGPKVIQDRHARIDDLAERMAKDVGVNRNVTRVTVGREMDLRLHLVPEPAFRAKVEDVAQFKGRLANAGRGGWTDAQYKAAWDEEFPGDPLEVAGAAHAITGPIES